ncbi:hypothetical protein V5O48_008706, partial [Marasmius crinis-equi]
MSIPTSIELSSSCLMRSLQLNTFNDLAFYFRYASSTSTDSCAKPNGKTLVLQINEASTDTQGYIARDDDRREIVVALRGTSTIQDDITDIAIILVSFISPDVNAPFGSLVHAGFLTA